MLAIAVHALEPSSISRMKSARLTGDWLLESELFQLFSLLDHSDEPLRLQSASGPSLSFVLRVPIFGLALSAFHGTPPIEIRATVLKDQIDIGGLELVLGDKHPELLHAGLFRVLQLLCFG